MIENRFFSGIDIGECESDDYEACLCAVCADEPGACTGLSNVSDFSLDDGESAICDGCGFEFTREGETITKTEYVPSFDNVGWREDFHSDG